ncbi:polysaccharide deacetylase family protein [Scytonema sp. UIC 10036]|uniref:polysaccharide deacetylase family protein n=1 Tax=Scytonema sp. UIC 10036 TaxID=2304196 RepID=UPI0012DA5FAA|nr:polysaccharide deacetylase family protein [Scytonema sp. UIC 10036]MUG92916.1 polysaccharide deacetylase family protein [Scytonema sp. UIC 10036]
MSNPISWGDRNKPQIALTFDDGPYEEVTPKLLDVLRRHSVKATFFCIGQRVDRLPEIVKQTYEEGHLIANHSYDGNLHLRREDDNKVLKELRDANAAIQKATGYIPKYFRPPFGEPPFEDNQSNDNVSRVTELAKTLGLVHIHWSLDTNDWRSPGVDSIVKDLMSAQNGSIILCHDLPREANQTRGEDTIKAVDQAIPELKKRGLSFVTIEELLSSMTQPPSERECPQGSIVYVVQSGDYLSKIAERFYGDGSEQSWRKIYEANKDLIGNPEQIEPGWKLCLPQ